MAAYRDDLFRAASAFGAGNAPPPDIGVLIDLRQHMIQPKDVAQDLQSLVERFAAATNPCALIISTSAIQKSQSSRVGGSLQKLAFFSTEDEALQWLLQQAMR